MHACHSASPVQRSHSYSASAAQTIGTALLTTIASEIITSLIVADISQADRAIAVLKNKCYNKKGVRHIDMTDLKGGITWRH